MIFFSFIFWLIAGLLCSALALAPLALIALAIRGRGLPKTLHRPGLGWTVLGGYWALCLFIFVFAFVAGSMDEEARSDATAIIKVLAGFPWSTLIGWPLLAARRASNLYSQSPWPSEWWDLLNTIVFAASVALNSFFAYQFGKRLPVIWAARPTPPPPPLLATLWGRPLIRRSMLAGGLIALVGFGWWYATRPLTDDQLISRFRANRAAFDQLVQMYVADDRDVLIDVDGSYRVRPAYPAPEGPGYPAPERLDADGRPVVAPIAGIDPGGPALPQPTAVAPPSSADEARRMEYVALLRQVGLTSIWPGTLNQGLYGGQGFSRDYPGPHRIVRMVVSTRRMFIYAHEPLELANDQGVLPPPGSPPLAEGLLPGGGLTTRCQRIEDQWYLCSRLAYGD